MSVNCTHTYAKLAVSEAAFLEILAKLRDAGYTDQFHLDDGAITIDMHGLALVQEGAGSSEQKPG